MGVLTCGFAILEVIKIGTIKKTKFQVYNGTDYDTKYFETSADQVKMADGDTVEDAVQNLKTTKLNTANVANNLTTTQAGYALDARQGKALSDQVATRLSAGDVANNLTTTQAGKVLDARQGKALSDQIGNKLNTSDVVNNLTTTGAGKALDARQGKILNDKFGSYVPLAGTSAMTGPLGYTSGNSDVSITRRVAGTSGHEYNLVWGGRNNVGAFFLWDATAEKAMFGLDASESQFYVRTDQLWFGLAQARLSSAQNQQCYLWASQEAEYAIGLGVFGGSWKFMPNRNDGAITLGGPDNRWGQVYSTTGSISTSDHNLKKDIHTLDEKQMAEFVLGLDPVGYKFKENSHGRQHFGLIAQQVEEVMTQVGLTDMDFAGFIRDHKVTNVYNGDGTIKEQVPVEGEYTYSLRYEEFIAPLISTVQRQAKLIDTLSEKISALKARVEALESAQ